MIEQSLLVCLTVNQSYEMFKRFSNEKAKVIFFSSHNTFSRGRTDVLFPIPRSGG